MAVPVQYQKKGKSEAIGQAGTVVGGVLGAIYGGGPAGAYKGAQMGGAIGGAAGNMFDQQTEGPGSIPSQQGGMGADIPDATVENNPEKTLMEAQMALKDASPEQQQQYGPAIQSALLKLRRERAV